MTLLFSTAVLVASLIGWPLTDAELMDACKQFEAYFIEQMYKGMMKTIPTNENNSNYTLA